RGGRGHREQSEEPHRLAYRFERAQPRRLEPRSLHLAHRRLGAREPRTETLCELLFVHSVIPFDFRIFAKVCVAREQCVFTLPSEQPMTLAVSLTSSSSQ